jgi:hypothetical protein
VILYLDGVFAPPRAPNSALYTRNRRVSDADNLLDRCRTELGEPDADYSSTSGRFWAKLVVGLVLLVGGVIANYVVWVHAAAAAGVFAKLLIAPPIAGVALLWHLYRSRGLHVLLYPTGLLRLQRGVVESFPWDDITQVFLKADKATLMLVRDEKAAVGSAWLAVETPTFQLWNAILTVKRTDETDAKFTPAVSGYEDLVERVQRATFPPLYAAALAAVREGRPATFGPFDVTSGGLTHAGKLVPWTDLGDVSVGSKAITLKRKGKWLAWATVALDTVPNPHVFLALVEEVKSGRRAAVPRAEPTET